MNPTTREIILEFIRKSKRGLTISQLRKESGLSRETVTKYLEVLHVTNEIRMSYFGNARVFYV